MAWQTLIDLKDIVELVVALAHTDESIEYVEGKISGRRQKYQDLFPDMKLFPKHHYLEHYPQLIRRFGPLVAPCDLRPDLLLLKLTAFPYCSLSLSTDCCGMAAPVKLRIILGENNS